MEFIYLLHSGFLVGHNWLISVLNHSENNQNTRFKAETEKQA